MSEAEKERKRQRYIERAMDELDLQHSLLLDMEPGTWPEDSEMGRRWQLIEAAKARGKQFQKMAREL